MNIAKLFKVTLLYVIFVSCFLQAMDQNKLTMDDEVFISKLFTKSTKIKGGCLPDLPKNVSNPSRLEELIVQQALGQNILNSRGHNILTGYQKENIEKYKKLLVKINTQKEDYSFLSDQKSCCFKLNNEKIPVIHIRGNLKITMSDFLEKILKDFNNNKECYLPDISSHARKLSACTYTKSWTDGRLFFYSEIAIDPFLKIVKHFVPKYVGIENQSEVLDDSKDGILESVQKIPENFAYLCDSKQAHAEFKLVQNILFFSNSNIVHKQTLNITPDPIKTTLVEQALLHLAIVKGMYKKMLLLHTHKYQKQKYEQIIKKYPQNILDILPAVTLKECESSGWIDEVKNITIILELAMSKKFEAPCNERWFNCEKAWPEELANVQITPCTQYSRRGTILITKTIIDVDKALKIMKAFDGNIA